MKWALVGASWAAFFAFPGVENVAVAVMEEVCTDAGVGVAFIVRRAVAAEFDVFLKAALGFDFSGIGSGFSRGVDGFLGVRFIGGAVEAAAEQFFGGIEAVAGFEVRLLSIICRQRRSRPEDVMVERGGNARRLRCWLLQPIGSHQ